MCVNPLVPFDASHAAADGRLTGARLNEGGLPIVLAQTFRAIIHSRMKVGMEKYRRQYPDADVILFEPDREDADMFFASIFSYSQRRRLCAAAYAKTRQNLLARTEFLAPQFARHGLALRRERLADSRRRVEDAISDPRPLNAQPGTSVRATAATSRTRSIRSKGG